MAGIRLIPYLLLLSLLIMGGCLSKESTGENDMVSGRDVGEEETAKTVGSSDGRTLGSEPIEATLAGGEIHRWQWVVPAESFAVLAVDQRGIDIELRLFAPGSDEPLRVADGIGGEWEVERLAVATEGETTFRVEVEALHAKAPATTYQLEPQPPRPLDDTLRAEAAAEEAWDRGERLRRQNTPERLRAAQRQYRNARRHFEQAHAIPGQMRCLQRLGMLDVKLRQSAEARVHWNALLALARDSGHRHEEAHTLLRLGDLAFEEGLGDRAGELTEQGHRLARELGDQALVARSLNNRAALYARSDDLVGALRDYRTAAELWEQIDRPRDRATTLNNLATVLQLQGKTTEALDALTTAERLRLEADDTTGAAWIRHRIATFRLGIGEPVAAKEDFQRAWELGGDEGGNRSVFANGLGLVHAELGELDEAARWLDEARGWAIGHHMPRHEAIAALNLADVRRRQGEVEAAEQLLDRAQELFDGLRDTLHRPACDLIAGWILRDQGQPELALTRLEQAVEGIEAVRGDQAGWGLRMSFFATRQTYYEAWIDLLVARFEATHDVGLLEEAIQVGERRRARSLLDALAESRLRFGGDATLLDQERRLSERLDEVDRDVRVANPTDRPDLDRRRRQLLVDLETTRAVIQRSSPQYADLVRPRPLELAAIRERVLDRHTRLLVYELGERRSFLFVLTLDGEPRVHVLPGRGTIEEAVERVVEEFPNLSPKRTEHRWRWMNRLTDMVLGPLDHDGTEGRLAIVADGALLRIPFAALPEPRRGSGDDATDSTPRPFLIERYEVVHLPSASTLAALREETAHKEIARYQIAVFADPVFGPDDERWPGGASLEATSAELPARSRLRDKLHRLPATHEEGEAIRQLVAGVEDSSLFAYGFEASRTTFEDQEIEEFKILHFATHGILDAEHPELSGLVLSRVDEQGKPRNGFVRAHELYSRRFGAELVVLSACQTGVGTIVRGEGMVGLPRGFLYAGVPRVVVSLWKVADRSTAHLMQRFYRYLADGISPSTALRHAQLEMLRPGEDQPIGWEHPFYWAPFIFLGDWRGSYALGGGVGHDDDGSTVLEDPTKGPSYDQDLDAPGGAVAPAVRGTSGPSGAGPSPGDPDIVFVNGIDLDTGHLLSPDPPGEPEAMRVGPREWRRLTHWKENQDTLRLPIHGVDPENLAQAGWGVIYGPDVDQDVKDALAPLVAHRQEEAGTLFEAISLSNTPNALAFLTDRGVAFGRAVPEKLPYYLLLVGDPAKLPFEFQYGVDVQHAVGRLHFEQADHYAAYVAGVLAAEQAADTGRQATFWATDISDDPMAHIMLQGLVEPLVGGLTLWQEKEGLYTPQRTPDGRKATLLHHLTEQKPAFLHTASHGAFSRNPDKVDLVGALITEDWDGAQGPLPTQVLFTADDLPETNNLEGMITCHFACYSAGRSANDPFQPGPLGRGRDLGTPLVSPLAKRLLRQGAQAVIGHIDRAWETSFTHDRESEEDLGSQTPITTSMLRQLFQGHRIGHATEPINSRYAESASHLNPLLDPLPRRNTERHKLLQDLRKTTLDARNYIVLGDPAVRLPGATERRQKADEEARRQREERLRGPGVGLGRGLTP